ncbi:predicted protein [Histoplasma mississippiense (nom. inval.)]|uniref:predicted protein n=1 Tax=Ajellomyces capsulatus (strain NAm1 / WU24) TaxID=2059318 RepID=UPI000157C173|nr:predicted protein [Histoplasma mississippiense (nom. inval.)]EDN07783.1 predicted protein [Histoplasma mississippiense (nom. inval.)]
MQAISKNKEATKLYEGTSLGSYVATTRTTAIFCFLYAGWNFYTTTSDPLLSVSHFTTYALGGICILMGAMGAVFVRRGTSLITGITASPTHGSIPEIRIKIRRTIGFLKPREIVTSPSQVKLSSPIFVSKQQLQTHDMRRIREAFHERAIGPRLSFFKEPLKKISYFTWKTLINMRRAFTQEGFVYVEVKGMSGTFCLDMTGYFGDEFLAFESLVFYFTVLASVSTCVGTLLSFLCRKYFSTTPCFLGFIGVGDLTYRNWQVNEQCRPK